jgi:hypothetical protein
MIPGTKPRKSFHEAKGEAKSSEKSSANPALENSALIANVSQCASTAAPIAERSSINASESPLELSTRSTESSAPLAAPTTANSAADIDNPARREMFQNIVPTFGQSLVKLLRVSNHLKHELSETLDQIKKR